MTSLMTSLWDLIAAGHRCAVDFYLQTILFVYFSSSKETAENFRFAKKFWKFELKSCLK